MVTEGKDSPQSGKHLSVAAQIEGGLLKELWCPSLPLAASIITIAILC